MTFTQSGLKIVNPVKVELELFTGSMMQDI